MASINSVTIMGNLGNDPELATGKSGQPWCRLRIATNRYTRNENGEREAHTTWHNVTAFGKTAEACATYLKKGRMVFVDGRIDNSTYKRDDGTQAYWSEIIARDIQFISAGNATRPPLAAEPESLTELISKPKKRVSAVAENSVPF